MNEVAHECMKGHSTYITTTGYDYISRDEYVSPQKCQYRDDALSSASVHFFLMSAVYTA